MEIKNFFKIEGAVATLEVTGTARAVALAHDEGEPVVVYIVGSTTSVNAIRAKFNSRNRKAANVWAKRTWGHGFTNLQASKTMKHVAVRDERIQEDNLLLLSAMLVSPQYGDTRAYVLSEVGAANMTDSIYATKKAGQIIKNCVSMPILPEWYGALVRLGLEEKRIKRLPESFGCRAWRIDTNENWWTEQISKLLRDKVITISTKY